MAFPSPGALIKVPQGSPKCLSFPAVLRLGGKEPVALIGGAAGVGSKISLRCCKKKRERYPKEKRLTLLWKWEEQSHPPEPEETDGEASTPGPRLRKRGPRSEEARANRRQSNEAKRKARADVGSVTLHDETVDVLHLNMLHHSCIVANGKNKC